MEREIRHFLESTDKDYAVGVAIYSQYGTSETLKRMFLWGKTAYNQEKLVEALERLLANGPIYSQSPSVAGIIQVKLSEVGADHRALKPSIESAMRTSVPNL